MYWTCEEVWLNINLNMLKASLFLSLILLLFRFLSLTRCLCCPAVLARVNRVQGGRISFLCLSMIRPVSLMQSYYLHRQPLWGWSNSYSVCTVVSVRFRLRPDHVCTSGCVYYTSRPQSRAVVIIRHTDVCCAAPSVCFLPGVFTPRWPWSKQTARKYPSVQAKTS